MGGSDDPSNLILLSIKKHALAHKKLWETYNKIEDFMAWKMLSGKTKEAEIARIKLANTGFKTFIKSKKSKQWRKKISKSLTGLKKSDSTKSKLSASLKKAYESGKKVKPNGKSLTDWIKNNPKKSKQLSAEGRKKSKLWKNSVTSAEYRDKKSKLDPRSRLVNVNGIEYSSIRKAAKVIGIPYSKLRNLLNGNNFITLSNI
jgi:hypothetical protein